MTQEVTDHAGVLVVGAGPVGLVLAADLVRQGVPVRIVDAAPGDSPHSRAIVMWPRTLELLRRLDVKQRDLRRINELTAGDRSSYWSLVQENHDDLKWCGSSPIYTFLNAVPEARGDLLHYDQWQIDAGSVVSFAALRFE